MDYEDLRETMVSLGEALEDLGFEAPLQQIEGNSRIGAACRNCRSDDDQKVVAFYLKDLYKTFGKLKPSEKRQSALQVCDWAWKNVKRAADERSDEEKAAARAAAVTRRNTGAPQRNGRRK